LHLLNLVFLIFHFADAQVHVGVYHSGLVNQLGVGTDIDKKYFGEIRLHASDLFDFPFGVEGLFHRNFKRTNWYNLHAGLMLGVFEFGSFRVGLPLGLGFKPIANHRNFSLLLEGTPNLFPDSGSFNIRANIGLRYTFRKEE
jgi:hypothetical protein